MAFQVSPGVQIREFDLTAIVPAIATTPAGYVGVFQWGPADQRVLVSTEKELENIFFSPLNDAYYATSWLLASNFLAYGGNLQVVRYVNSVTGTAAANTNFTRTSNQYDLNAVSLVAGPGTPETLSASDTVITIKNREHYENITINGLETPFNNAFIARYPGKLGNSIGIVMLMPVEGSNWEAEFAGAKLATSGNLGASGTTANITQEIFNAIRNAPDTTEQASELGFSKDEIHIAIIDANGLLSGVVGQVLELYEGVSVASDALNGDGTTNYWINVINNKSQYVHVGDIGSQLRFKSAGLAWGSAFSQSVPGPFKIAYTDTTTQTNETFAAFEFDGGVNATRTTDNNVYASNNATLSGNILAEYQELFGDPDESDVSIFIGYNTTSETDLNSLVAISEKRKDSICFVSANYPLSNIGSNRTTIKNAIIAFANNMASSSYGVLDSGYKYQYDRFNNVYRYVPLCADTAGCAVRTDDQKDPWFSPAGYDRGRILNTVKLVFNPNQGERDELYKKNVNPVITSQGFGVILFGDKTLQKKPSAFDRINVRRLFNVLEKSIATAAKFQLFEFNDAFTRTQFKQLVEPFLRDVQGRRGITSYSVVCDESNNTPTIIDGNRFVADIFVAPNRSINFIQLNFVATPTGVSFAEYGG
jgi:phage tail sheath protein FI